MRSSYDKAIEIDSKNALAWNYKGKLLQQLGLEVEAMKCFEKARELGYEEDG